VTNAVVMGGQALLNSLGIYVGLVGARSAHTLNPQLAKVSTYRKCYKCAKSNPF
jgi:hypothetical protein